MRIDSLKDFLEVQKQYAELIVALYTRRNLAPVSYREAVELCGGDDKGEAKLHSFLVARRLGIETDTGIVLDPTLRQAYERVMHTNTTLNDEVISHIRPEVEKYCEQWDDCQTTRDKQVVFTDLYQTIERIPDGLEQSISDLSRFMEEQYKAAISFKLKRAKLEALSKQAGQIQRLLDESHRLLSDDSHKIRTVIARDRDVNGSLLTHLLHRAKLQLHLSSESLVAVTRRLQEYISKVERASCVAKRAHLLARMIREETLNSETNFLDIVDEYNDIGIKGETYIKIDKVDVISMAEDGLYSDIFADIAAGNIYARETRKASPSIDIDEDPAPGQIAFYRPNYKTFFRSFAAQRKDLFIFIMDYDFPEAMPMGQRIELFLYFCSSPEYGTSLDFEPGEYGTYSYVSDRTGEPIVLDYQIVKAR